MNQDGSQSRTSLIPTPHTPADPPPHQDRNESGSLVLDRVLRFVPALDVWLFVHDQGAEVPRIEHDDVGGLGGHIEHHEGADQDAGP